MPVHFEPSVVSRAEWDDRTGRNFYGSANWLDFCVAEHGGAVDAVVAADGPAGTGVAVPVSRGLELAGSPYDWNTQLADRSLPALPAAGLLVGACEGYQTQVLRGAAQPDPDAVTRLLDELRAQAGDQACVAMFLGTADVRLLRAAGVPAPAVLLEPDAWLPVPDGGFDAWLAARRPKRQNSVRREVEAFESAGYRIQHLPLRECSAEIAPLAVRTEAKYGFQATEAEDLESLRNHAECLGDAAMVALCTLDDRPVGFCLYYVWRDAVFIRWTGFDYGRLQDAYEYFNLLYYEQLRWAPERGIRWIHAGLKAVRAKVLRGAVIRPLWMLDLAAASPLADAGPAVRERNAAFLGELLADGTVAGGIADRAEWDAEQ